RGDGLPGRVRECPADGLDRLQPGRPRIGRLAAARVGWRRGGRLDRRRVADPEVPTDPAPGRELTRLEPGREARIVSRAGIGRHASSTTRLPWAGITASTWPTHGG